MDGSRDHWHRFPESVLSEIRHVSQRVAAAGARNLQADLRTRGGEEEKLKQD